MGQTRCPRHRTECALRTSPCLQGILAKDAQSLSSHQETQTPEQVPSSLKDMKDKGQRKILDRKGV